jgi:cation diffusion facilitator CzcD-associated flavoprotein CzcO
VSAPRATAGGPGPDRDKIDADAIIAGAGACGLMLAAELRRQESP